MTWKTITDNKNTLLLDGDIVITKTAKTLIAKLSNGPYLIDPCFQTSILVVLKATTALHNYAACGHFDIVPGVLLGAQQPETVAYNNKHIETMINIFKAEKIAPAGIQAYLIGGQWDLILPGSYEWLARFERCLQMNQVTHISQQNYCPTLFSYPLARGSQACIINLSTQQVNVQPTNEILYQKLIQDYFPTTSATTQEHMSRILKRRQYPTIPMATSGVNLMSHFEDNVFYTIEQIEYRTP